MRSSKLKFPLNNAWVISSLLFVFLFYIGILLSLHKPLWNDELYTQVRIESVSFPQILEGRMLLETNNCPLFYLAQKAFCWMLRFHLPFVWGGELEIAEPYSQILLRILPNIFMALAVTIIFYFFSRRYSRWWGIYALALTLSSPMVWLFWAEARPYGLWFLLTVWQCLLFLDVEGKPKEKNSPLTWLAVNHLLLALTSSAAILQITIVSALVFVTKKCNIREVARSLGFPGLIFLFYYPRAMKPTLHVEPIPGILLSNIPAEFLVLGAGYLLWTVLTGRTNSKTRSKGRLAANQATSYTWFFFSTIIVSVVALIFMEFSSTPDTITGVTNRHLIYLAPMGMIAVVVILAEIYGHFQKQPWARLNVLIVAGGILLTRILEALPEVISKNVFH